jgi:hypothetical protein
MTNLQFFPAVAWIPIAVPRVTGDVHGPKFRRVEQSCLYAHVDLPTTREQLKLIRLWPLRFFTMNSVFKNVGLRFYVAPGPAPRRDLLPTCGVRG